MTLGTETKGPMTCNSLTSNPELVIEIIKESLPSSLEHISLGSGVGITSHKPFLSNVPSEVKESSFIYRLLSPYYRCPEYRMP